MQKIKKGDEVVIIAGKDKGKRGSVIRIKSAEYLVVQGINIIKKHQKPNPVSGNSGGIIDREMPIHISNVAIYNFNTKKADRVGFKFDAEKNKIRIFKSSGDFVES